MVFIEKNGLSLLQFESFRKEEGLVHCVTTREGGISGGHAAGLNLSYSVEDDPQHVQRNRERLAEAMEVKPDHLVFPKQTHSDYFRIVTKENYTEEIQDTDALITAAPGIALAVMSADCVPVLLYDREKKVIAAIHAGWKGTVNGIVDKVVSAMKKEFGCLPGNIRAGIGPSICAASYEVGPEVIAQFREKVPDTEKLFSNFHGEKAHVDLWEANRAWLLRQGVPEENIEVAGICTFQNPGRFFSARYFKNRTGRFAACIALREIC